MSDFSAPTTEPRQSSRLALAVAALSSGVVAGIVNALVDSAFVNAAVAQAGITATWLVLGVALLTSTRRGVDRPTYLKIGEGFVVGLPCALVLTWIF